MSKAEVKKRPGTTVLKVLLGIIIALLIIIAILFIIPLTETGDLTAVDGSADWMARLPDDISISEITLPGTHDSATQFVQLGFVTKCQSLSIAQQLDAGCRYLDIRLAAAYGRLKLMHSFTTCKDSAAPWSGTLFLDPVLDQCYSFLEEHPSETVVFAVKQEYGDESISEFEILLNSYIAKNPERWLNSDTLPTLGEARGKLVLMRRYTDDANIGAAAGIPLLWANQGGHDDVSLNTAESDNGSYTLWVQDRYNYAVEDKWVAFNEGMKEPDDSSVVISFLSTAGTFYVGHPYAYAKDLNRRVFESDNLSGWVILDFASAPLAEHIYSKNFS